jgi:aminomethyltransferase
MTETLAATPLEAWHRQRGATMAGFAGHLLPIAYPEGALAEHRACRTHAALFDVSHMGQLEVAGDGAAAALERLIPADLEGLAVGRQRYAVFTTPEGGILDDLMIARLAPERFFLVVNAARREADLAHLRHFLPPSLTLTPLSERALLALQGPAAAALLGPLAPEAAALPYLGIVETQLLGVRARISRSGYTGEDGFEISLPAAQAIPLAEALTDRGATPAGLAARDSLRLEAGLCLYGQDIDETTSPIEAGLAWTIPRRRRAAADFLGAERILRELAEGPPRLRVGLRLEGRQPARAQSPVYCEGEEVGRVTSGGFSPTLEVAIAMALLDGRRAEASAFTLGVRGRLLPARRVPFPFVPHRTVRRG